MFSMKYEIEVKKSPTKVKALKDALILGYKFDLDDLFALALFVLDHRYCRRGRWGRRRRHLPIISRLLE